MKKAKRRTAEKWTYIPERPRSSVLVGAAVVAFALASGLGLLTILALIAAVGGYVTVLAFLFMLIHLCAFTVFFALLLAAHYGLNREPILYQEDLP